MHTTPSSLKLKRACIMGITQQNIAVRYSNHYAIRSPTRYFSWQCFSQIFVYDMNLINKIEETYVDLLSLPFPYRKKPGKCESDSRI